MVFDPEQLVRPCAAVLAPGQFISPTLQLYKANSPEAWSHLHTIPGAAQNVILPRSAIDMCWFSGDCFLR
jgi:hypothetical protein